MGGGARVVGVLGVAPPPHAHVMNNGKPNKSRKAYNLCNKRKDKKIQTHPHTHTHTRTSARAQQAHNSTDNLKRKCSSFPSPVTIVFAIVLTIAAPLNRT